jgi:hypothetical protein
MAKSSPRGSYPLSDEHLYAIGGIVVIWSHIELAMEVAICGLYDINIDRGLVLTANIGFQSRVSLLRILATRGAIKDKATAADLLKLLARVEERYAERNAVAHGVWSGTEDPKVARRMSIRAKGNRLKCADDPVSFDQVDAVCAKLDALRVDFARMLRRLNLKAPTGD